MKNIKVCPADGAVIQGGFRFSRETRSISVWGRTFELAVQLDDGQIRAIADALADESTAAIHATGQVVGRVWEIEA